MTQWLETSDVETIVWEAFDWIYLLSKEHLTVRDFIDSKHTIGEWLPSARGPGIDPKFKKRIFVDEIRRRFHKRGFYLIEFTLDALKELEDDTWPKLVSYLLTDQFPSGEVTL